MTRATQGPSATYTVKITAEFELGQDRVDGETEEQTRQRAVDWFRRDTDGLHPRITSVVMQGEEVEGAGGDEPG